MNFDVYIPHLKGLSDRIHNLINLLEQCEMIGNIHIVTNEDSDLQFSTIEEKLDILPPDFPNRDLTKSEKSLWHKHYKIFQMIFNEQLNDEIMVLEDDVLFEPNKLDHFLQLFITNKSSLDFDFIFFGTGCNLSLDGTGFIKNYKQQAKCADSMLISKTAAGVLYNDIKNYKVHLPIDWDLNYRFPKLKQNIYWFEPGVVQQGSQNGVYNTTIRQTI